MQTITILEDFAGHLFDQLEMKGTTELMQALGRQILVEFYDCSESKLNSVSFIEEAMVRATKRSHATVISHNFHKFSPYGVSGVVVIAESHVAIHTWPEYNYAAVDIFTCGETIDPWLIQELLKEDFESRNASSMELKRGLFKMAEGEKLRFKPSEEAVSV